MMRSYSRNFEKKKKNNSGRGLKGNILIRSKQCINSFNYKIYDQKRININLLGIVIALKLNISQNLLSLVKYSNGIISCIKLAYGLNLGSFIKSINFPLRLFKVNVLGFRVYLKLAKLNMIFFDLGLFNKNPIYTKSAGTFSQILQINKEVGFILITLPSGKKKYVNLNYLCTLGRNNNIFKKFSVIGKAGVNRNLGKNITVRGVAMNPVDHPHGGRTKTNKPEVSPWGWVTKHSH